MNTKVLKEICLTHEDYKRNTSKYYILRLIEENGVYKVIALYGRLGNKPQRTEKTLSYNSALATFNSKESEKFKKGYVRNDIEYIMAHMPS